MQTASKMQENPVERVMLVDDNETDNFINKRIIELSGFANEVLVKNSGKGALEFLTEEQDNVGNLPGIIFLDINMPIVDGFVFLFEFEDFPQHVKDNCKIVILSSSDNKKDIDRIVDNEYVDHFITKPLTEEALHRIKLL